MQDSRPSTPTPPSSSPPTASSQQLANPTFIDARSPSSPNHSEWVSPTQTLGYSSPELPPLPSLQTFAGPSGPLGTAQDDGEYYTASWGSPYRNPPPGSVALDVHQERELFGSDDTSDASSEIQFGLDHLLPSRVADEESPDFGLDYLLPSRLSLNQATPTANHFAQLAETQDLTPRPLTRELFQSILEQGPGRLSEDWFRQFFAGKTQEQADWSEEESFQSDIEDIKVSKASQSQKGTPSKSRSEKERKVSKGHKPRGSNLTLKQEDFWTHFSQGQQETLAKMMASRFAPKVEERSAPPLPAKDTIADGPQPKPEVVSTEPAKEPAILATSESVASKPVLAPIAVPAPVPAPVDTQVQSQSTKARSPIILDKPLPTPPPEENVSPRPSSPQVKRNQDLSAVPESAPTPPPKRARKTIKSAKGRNHIIDLPPDIPRGAPGQPPKILAPEEVKARMKKFEKAGYDTRGFGHWRGRKNLIEPPGHAQNRDEFPDPSEQREPMAQKSFHVKIPNQAEWKAYQDFLMEQKLAALGVSLGGGPEEAAPSSANMSRQTSGQYPPLPFSPPIPSQSSNSQRHGHSASIFSGSFSTRGPSPGHQSTRSIASPLSSIGNPRGSISHMHRHSTFTSPSVYAPQPTPPGMSTFSPQGYFNSQGVARGGSPAGRPDLAEKNVSASPLSFNPQSFSFPQSDDMLAQFQALQQQRQSPLQNQGVFGMRPASTLAEVPEADGESEDDVLSRPQLIKRAETDIAVPVPRGHRHSISDTLERDVESADYHLEDAIDKQLNEGGEFSPGGRFGLDKAKPSQVPADDDIPEWRRPRPVEQVLHQPQPHNRTHSLTQPQRKPSLGYNKPAQEALGELSDGEKTNISEITNPSAEEKAIKADISRLHSTQNSIGSSAWQPGHGSRASKASLGSTLNAGAKEFKFNPTATFKPGNFAFGSSGFDFQPPTNSNPFSQSVPTGSKPPTFAQTQNTWNVAAPAFTPGASVGSNFSSDFNFASNGPAFKAEAPTFQPNFAEPAPATHRSKESIFGPINFSHKDIVKPARRSKAVPIVKPDASLQPFADDSVGETEDVDGRIVQSSDRFKRSRHTGDDGDDVPLFASPSGHQDLGSPAGLAVSEPRDERSSTPAGDATPTDVTSALSKESAAEPSAPSHEKADVDDKSSATPVATKDFVSTMQKDLSASKYAHDRETSKHSSKTSLSAFAKEFTPRFGSGQNFEFGLHVTKPSGVTEIDDVPAFPTRHVSQSPGTTFRPSDDGSYKTAFSRRRNNPDNESVDFDSFAHPSFNEIDEVMKAMNEEGSDFGVERDEPSWDQSSQQRGSMDFNDTITLRPTQHFRSDAPSPSPRRLFPRPGVRHGESTEITQDPFSDSKAGLAYESPVHRLNNAQDVAVSDWDDMISEGQDGQLQARAQFFDNRVDALIDSALASRFGPLEEHLRMIQEQLASASRRGARSARRSYSTERRDSDADDEDDDNDDRFRNRSPEKSRKMEKLRAIVLDALASYEPRSASNAPAAVPLDLSDVHQTLAELKVAMVEQQARSPPTPPKVDLSEIQQGLSRLEAAAEEQRRQPVRLSTPPPAPVVDASIVQQVADGLKTTIAEQLAQMPTHPVVDLSPIHQSMADIKASLSDQQSKEATAAPIEMPAPDLTEFYQALSDFKLSLVEKQSAQDSAPKTPPPPAVDPALLSTINEMKTSLQEHLQAKMAESTEVAKEEAAPPFDLAEIYQALAAMKVQLAQSASTHVQLEDFKDIMEEALTRQSRLAEEKNDTFKQILEERISRHDEHVQTNSAQFKDVLEEAIARHASVGIQNKDDLRELLEDAFNRQDLKTLKREESASILEHTGRISDLEAMFNEASATLGREREARAEIEAQHSDTERLLRLAEEEVRILRAQADDSEQKNRSLEGELQNVQQRSISHKHAEDELRKKHRIVEDQVEALEATLDEYRTSSNKWRDDMAQAKMDNEELERKYDTVNMQVEEAMRVRETMRSKLEKLQDDMSAATGSITTERATWQKREEEYRIRYEILSARAESEARMREQAEREKERLLIQEREGMQFRIKFEHAEAQAAKLEERLSKSTEERNEYERQAIGLERELRDARDHSHTEVAQVRRLLETEIEAANNMISNHKLNSEMLKSSYETQLREAEESKRRTLAETQSLREECEHELRERHVNVCNMLRDQHMRAIETLREDNQRRQESFREESQQRETNLADRLALADDKNQHLQQKVRDLENQLKVTRDAAQAAAQAAQAAGTKLPAVLQPSGIRAGPPEKVSPQALRESIMVLQEQLQEREGRIESLERQLDDIDKEAPAKLKERDTEIGWLRELLGVRLDDLSELIDELKRPNFSRETVRDTAIRIRTTLQMEQHEKERLISGSPANAFPTLATISNLATPKAAQVAAAFNNWRRGSRAGSTASVSRPTSRAQPLSGSNRDLTPSRPKNHTSQPPTSAQSMFSNLMTPPPSNVRRTSPTPQPLHHARQPSQYSESVSAFASTGNRYSSSGQANMSATQLGKQALGGPSTPPLLRRSSYDLDANVAEEEFSTNGYYDDDESTVDGHPMPTLDQELEAGEERGWDFDPNPASQR